MSVMPSITRSSRNGSRREAVEQNLLEAVESLLRQGFSYTELPVQKIADEAGIPRSTFYLHFSDKAELIVRLSDRVYDDVFAAALEWFAGDHRSGLDGLADTLHRLVEVYRAHFPVLGAVMEVASYEPMVGKAYRTRILDFAAGMHMRLEAAREMGHLSPDVDIPMTADILCWTAERAITQHIVERPPETDRQFAAALARTEWLMMYGDARKPPAKTPRR